VDGLPVDEERLIQMWLLELESLDASVIYPRLLGVLGTDNGGNDEGHHRSLAESENVGKCQGRYETRLHT